jgi:outer membrane protein TolC
MAMALFPLVVLGQATDSLKTTHHEFSIQQTIDYARKNSVQVKNALLDVKMQQQVNREVTARAYPSINGSLGTTYNPNVATQVLPNFIGPATYQVLIDQGVKDGNGNPIVMPNDFGFIAAQFGTRYSASAGVSLSQILFDGQVFVGLQARNSLIESARKNVEITEDAIRVNIFKVYYQLVVSKTQIELIDSNIATLSRLLRDTRLIYQNGLTEQLDIDKLNVQLTNLQTERSKVINLVSNGYYGLKTLIGMPVTDELILTDTLSDTGVKEGLMDLANYKYEDRKEYQYAQIAQRLNEYNLRRYKLSQIPTITLNGNYAKSAQRNKWNFFGKGDWFTISNVSLNVSVPIFNGMFTRTKIAEVRIDMQRLQNQIDALQLSIDNEVATAKNNFQSAITNMDFQKKNMALADKVYQQTRKKYEVGVGSQSEINLARTDLKQAQTSYINSLYDAVIARIDYLKAIGKL